MARASSSTICLEVRSRTSGEEFIVTERSWHRSRIMNGRVVHTPLRAELKDSAGRVFLRVSANLLRCAASGEEVEVVGIAPSIRPTVRAR